MGYICLLLCHMLSRRIGFDEVIESGFVSRRGIGGSGLDRGRNTRLQHRSCYVEPTTNQSFRRICACRVKCGIFVRLYFSLLIPKHLLLKDLIMMLKFCECTTTVQISVGAGWLDFKTASWTSKKSRRLREFPAVGNIFRTNRGG